MALAVAAGRTASRLAIVTLAVSGKGEIAPCDHLAANAGLRVIPPK